MAKKNIVRSVAVAGVVAGIATCAFLTNVGAHQKKEFDKRDQGAKAAVEQFVKAVIAEDIKATMMIVDVPFFFDGRENLKERAMVQSVFERIFDRKDLTTLSYEIKATHAFDKLPANALNEKDRRLLKDVLEKDDRVVTVAFTRNGVDADGMLVMIRFREGKVKVVGFRD